MSLITQITAVIQRIANITKSKADISYVETGLNSKASVQDTEYASFVYSMSATKTFTSGNATKLLTTGVYTIAKGRNIEVDIHIPARKNGTSWGGLYIHTNINVNGIWYNLGNAGYDGSIMNSGGSAISTFTQKKILKLVQELGLTEEYTVQIELMARSYSGISTINGSHDINSSRNGLGSRGLLQAWGSNQNYATVFIKEIT